MKVLPILAMLVGSALCSLEPAGWRTSSTYLPPNSRRQSSSLSSTYLPSTSRRQSSYSAPHSQNTYEPANYQSNQDSYLPPSRSNSHHSSSSVPSNRYIPSPPKDSYSLPEVADVRSSNVPAASYGVPEYSGSHSRGYHRHSHEDDWSGDAANYNFGYEVNDHYGTEFGHKETRSGTKTRGSYHVLLPDGRKQIVEYEADEHGYRPKISYENVQTDRAAYPSGGPY